MIFSDYLLYLSRFFIFSIACSFVSESSIIWIINFKKYLNCSFVIPVSNFLHSLPVLFGCKVYLNLTSILYNERCIKSTLFYKICVILKQLNLLWYNDCDLVHHPCTRLEKGWSWFRHTYYQRQWLRLLSVF